MAPNDPFMSAEIMPCGGIISLGLMSAATGTWSLTRSVSGASGLSEPVTLYNGPCLANISNDPPMLMPFIDANDGNPLPLSQTSAYVYTFTTTNGSVTSPPIIPAVTIEVVPDPLVELLIKIITAGLKALRVPAGFTNKLEILHAMPINTMPPLPSVFINQDLMQQEEVGIGDSVDPDFHLNRYTVSAIVSRRLNVTIATTTVQERGFYRDAAIAIWRSILGPFLTTIGQDVNQRFQAADTQNVEPDMQPGFYISELMFDFSGLFNVGVTTNYGIVRQIDFNPTIEPNDEVLR
jgi:hypothetical protein